jgi:hypothetical protein
MGGRGQALGIFEVFGGNGEELKFYDKTKQFSGLSLHEFEDKIRDKDVEYMGVFDKDGNLMIAGTSYNEGNVSFPMDVVDWSKAETFTHNHPNGGDRGIGGSFSGKDVSNAAKYNINVRAVASGKGEHTYILNKNREITSSDRKGLEKYIAKNYRTSKDFARRDKARNTLIKNVTAKGRTPTEAEKSAAWLGMNKKNWKNRLEKYGFTYAESKKPRW